MRLTIRGDATYHLEPKTPYIRERVFDVTNVLDLNP